MAKDNNWTIKISDFNAGLAPLSYIDNLTERGSGGHAAVMTNCNILDGKLTQGPELATLTNGTEAGVVTELINFIMDKAVSNDTTYGIGNTKLFEISSTAVASGGTFPKTVTNMTEGSSVIDLKGNLYYLYNTASAGAIGKYDLDTTFTDAWQTTGMVSAPHPVATKEDTMVFGNGRYLGVYIETGDSFNATKLDFGQGKQVDDVLFSGNQWYVVVNSNITGTNRSEGQIYLYDGSATTSTLTDETGVGAYRIGFIYRLNGIIYLAYQDLSSTGFIIGYISGSQIRPLGRFNGTLPTFAQKTLYKNTILFLSSGLVYSAGALVDELPFQLSQYADGGYSTTGAIACPFGTPLIASNVDTSYKLAQFSGYDVNAAWESIIFPLSAGKMKGYIDNITVLTNNLSANARCDLIIKGDQETLTSTTQQITGTSKRRHYFDNFGLNGLEDFKAALSFAEGSVTNPVEIRSITVSGHWVTNT
jgi:hypothetical protein